MPEKVLYQFCGSGEMPGGVQDSTNSIAGYMREQGLDPHVFIGSSENIDQTRLVFSSFVEPDTFHILGNANHYMIANGSQNPLGSAISPIKIYGELREVNPRIFHINAPWMPHIGGVALRMAQHRNIPTIATYHIVSEEPATNAALKISGAVDNKAIQRLDAMIAVSEPGRQHMEMVYGYKGDIHIIPNGVDVEVFEQAKPFEANEPFEGYDPSRPTIVFVGRPDPRKGLDALLHTFKLVHDELPDAQLLVCGGKKERFEITEDETLMMYLELADHLGISDATHFMGRVTDEFKARAFASANAAVMPSLRNESQGIVLLEAMAAGAKVVVGSNIPGNASVFNPQDIRCSDLMLLEPRQYYASKDQLIVVLTNDKVAQELHDNQQLLVRRKYDIQVVGHQILDLYKSLA